MTSALHPSLALDPDTLLSVLEAMGVMVLLCDTSLQIQATTPSMERFAGQTLGGKALTSCFPSLAGLENELIAMFNTPHDIWTMRQQRNEMATLNEQLQNQSQTLRKLNERLQHLERERRALLQVVLHDMRSALSVVAGFSELLADTYAAALDKPGLREALEANQQSVQRLQELLTHIQAIDTLQERLQTMNRQPLLLADLVQQQLAIHQGVARLQSITLTAELAAELPPITGDPEIVETVLAAALDDILSLCAVGSKVQVKLFRQRGWQCLQIVVHGRVSPALRQGGRLPTGQGRLGRVDFARVRLGVEGHGGEFHLQEKDGRLQQIILWWPEAQSTDMASPTGRDGTSHVGAEEGVLTAAGGRIKVDTHQKKVWLGDERMQLSLREYRLLEILARHPDQVLDLKTLVEAIWPDADQNEANNLRVLVWRLRRKLAQGNADDALRTLRGFGYMLTS